jgi:hypothetical protein
MTHVWDLLPHQDDLVYSKAAKSAMICGRGAGKSYALSYLALRDFVEGKNVLVGSQSVDTLHDSLWTEIKERAKEAGIHDFIDWHERPMRAYFNGATIYTGTYEAVDAKRSGSRVATMVLDELFLAPINILSVWGPVMRDCGFSPRIVAGTTPRKGSMWNTLFSSPDCQWEIIRASSRDNPHITEEEYALFDSGMLDDEMRRQELFGEIITGNRDMGIIQLADFPIAPAPTTDIRRLAGLDMSGGGERDACAFVVRVGNKVECIKEWHGTDSEQVAAFVLKYHREHPIDTIFMDLAWSESVYDMLKYNLPCRQIPFGSKAENDIVYENIRAEMFFNAAKAIKGGLCVDGCELSGELKRELCAMTWVKNSRGRFLICPKDDLRVVLGRSPDVADALALTCLHLWKGDVPQFRRADSMHSPAIAVKRRKACAMMQ